MAHRYERCLTGSEVAGSIPARSLWYEWVVWCEWRVRPKEGDTSTVSPWSFRHNVQQWLCFWPDWKNIFTCIKFHIRRPFPTYLGCHNLLFKGVTLQKENDGNLHFSTQTTHIINYNHPLHEQVSIITVNSHMSQNSVQSKHMPYSVEERHI